MMTQPLAVHSTPLKRVYGKLILEGSRAPMGMPSDELVQELNATAWAMNLSHREPEAAAEVGCLRSTLKLSAGWLETVLVGVVVIWARFYMHAELDKSAPLHTVIALAIAGVLGRFIQRAIDRAEARKIAQEQQALHNL